MAQKQDVWRLVGNMAIRCTDCQYNKAAPLTGETIVGVEYQCTAKDGLCDFTHTKPDNDKWYPGYKEAIADVPEEDEE